MCSRFAVQARLRVCPPSGTFVVNGYTCSAGTITHESRLLRTHVLSQSPPVFAIRAIALLAHTGQPIRCTDSLACKHAPEPCAVRDFHSKRPCLPAQAPTRMKQNQLVSISFPIKMVYNHHIGKNRVLFWACSPKSKLIYGSLICTTTCPASHGKRTHSKISTGREPCRKFSKEEVPL